MGAETCANTPSWSSGHVEPVRCQVHLSKGVSGSSQPQLSTCRREPFLSPGWLGAHPGVSDLEAFLFRCKVQPR